MSSEIKLKVSFFCLSDNTPQAEEPTGKLLQSVSMNRDAYREMTSPLNPMKGFTSYKWRRMNTLERLDAHFEALKNDIGADSFKYEIFDKRRRKCKKQEIQRQGTM